MTTSTATLTSFLLDRIADTIATAREIQALAVTRGIQPDDPREPSLRLAGVVLAECEAKRRIVTVHRGSHECPSEDSDCGWWTPATLCPTLRLLATPYADHPDYREEWRP